VGNVFGPRNENKFSSNKSLPVIGFACVNFTKETNEKAIMSISRMFFMVMALNELKFLNFCQWDFEFSVLLCICDFLREH